MTSAKRGKRAGKTPQTISGLAYWRLLLPPAILLIGLLFRTVSLTTFSPQVDEQITRDVVTGIWQGELSNNWRYTVSVPEYRIDQYNFSSYMYADALLVGLAAKLAPPADGSPDFVFWSRVFSALAGTLALWLFYLVAWRMFGPGTAIVSMALMAAMPLLVQDSHYARPEAFVVALTGSAYLLLLRFDARPERLRDLGYSCFCFGLLIACKVSLIPMAAVPLLFLASSKDRRFLFRGAGIWIAATLLGAFLGMPHAFFHPTAYWQGVQALRTQYAGAHPPHALIDGANSVSLTAMYFWQTTGLLLLFSLAGGGVLAMTRRFTQLAAIGGPVACYLVYFSSQRTFFERNLSHVAPLMVVLAGITLTALSERFPANIRAGVLWVLVAIAAAPSLWVSSKLVFSAMSIAPEQRALPYEVGLQQSLRQRIDGTLSLMLDSQLNTMLRLAATADHDMLLRIPDYHDSFTKKHLEELKQRTNWREVGYFPSVFEGYDVSTLIAYHAVSFHYLALHVSAAR